jgi:cell wall-associated NlpC family hydrolase
MDRGAATTARGAALIVAARGWLGTPWRHQGRGPEGVDCIGLVVLAAAAVGVALADRRDYRAEPLAGELRAELERQLCPAADLWPGVVLLLRLGPHAAHVGIWTGATLVHAYKPRGGVIEHALGHWRRRAVAAYGLPAGGAGA